MLRQPYRILVLDDEADFNSLITQMLDKLYQDKVQITSFTTPQSALKHFEKHGADLCLVDLVVGKISGDAVLQDCIKRNPQLITLIVTGSASPVTINNCFREGFHGYLLKPFEPEILKKTLDPLLALLDNWHNILQTA